MALTNKLTAIGDAIRTKTGTTELLTLDEMATAISGITTGNGSGGDLYDYIPESAFEITNDCSYMFYGDKWNWFVEQYGNAITTVNISNASNMFRKYKLDRIPFDINLSSTNDGVFAIASGLFAGSYLIELPYVTGKISYINEMFNSCMRLIEIPEDWADRIDWSNLNSDKYGECQQCFKDCYSLKHIPENLLMKLYSMSTSQNNSPYYQQYYNCYVLDEIKSMAVQPSTVTLNMFSVSFNGTARMKEITFAVQNNGTPYTANWKKQIISLTTAGYATNGNVILNYSSYHGITEEKEVTDDVSYQALKDDPDWWTKKVGYCRYNHDSAVNTINSLPDTSAYLATAGGTNTIKFDGAAGELTDGGAINTLTEEEIAVATAKGWTVTFA